MNIRKTLFTGLMLINITAFAQVTPFLTTTWNQTCYYNADCPTVSSGGFCGKAYTGCNSTAIGQIFNYYNYPVSGMGGNYCNAVDPSYCVDFSAQTYNYALMPDNVTSANPEVAKLLYQIGVSVDMQWSGTSSNSFFAPQAMKRFFGYSPRMVGKANFSFATTADLIAALKAEMDAGRPVMAKGGNHFYLIDGYNSSDQFHLNFGWSGTYNGYYAITSVVNGAGTFTPTNYIFGIEPMDGELETAVDTILISAASGSNEPVEFTSKLPWTVTTSDSWITPNILTGNSGYFNWQDGSHFSSAVNNGPLRYGYIYIQNAMDTDTIVVQQAASPLQVSPDELMVTAAAGAETVTVSYYVGSPWTATSADSWITNTPSSGSGNGTFNVNYTENTTVAERESYIIVNAGIYADTIHIVQEAGISTGIDPETELHRFTFSPNPFTGVAIINTSETQSGASFSILSLQGKVFAEGKLTGTETQLDLSAMAAGMYTLVVGNTSKRIVKH